MREKVSEWIRMLLCCLAILFCPGLFIVSPAFSGDRSQEMPTPVLPGEEEESPTLEKTEAVREEKADYPILTQDEIERSLREDVRGAGDWFTREKDALIRLILGSGSAAGIGFLAVMLMRILVRRRIEKARNAHKSLPLRWQLISSLSLPIIFLLVTLTVFFFLLPILNSLPDAVYPFDLKIFFTILTLIVVWGVFRVVEVFNGILGAIASRSDISLDCLLVNIIRKTVKVLIWVLTVLFIGQSIFELNIATVLTGAGALGLATAFLAKETLTNFLGAVIIVLDKPFHIGDRIRFNGMDGMVEEVGMRSCRLRTASESVICVPNSILTDSSIENVSAAGHLRMLFTIGLVYDSTPEQIRRAMQILHGIVDDFHGADPDLYKPIVTFHDFGASALNIEVILWLKACGFKEEDRMRNEINLKILQEFNSAGLSIAFPSVTNYLRGDPGHPLFLREEKCISGNRAASGGENQTAP